MRKILFLFGELRDNDVDWFGHNGYRRQVARGDYLMHQGEEDAYLYIVLDGEFDISVAHIGRIATIGSGEVVGEMSFVSDLLPSADVIAADASRVLAIPREALRAHIEDDPEFGLRFYRALAVFLASRLHGTVQRLGYGELRSEPESTVQELEGNALDTVYLAGIRFERLINQVAAGRAL